MEPEWKVCDIPVPQFRTDIESDSRSILFRFGGVASQSMRSLPLSWVRHNQVVRSRQGGVMVVMSGYVVVMLRSFWGLGATWSTTNSFKDPKGTSKGSQDRFRDLSI